MAWYSPSSYFHCLRLSPYYGPSWLLLLSVTLATSGTSIMRRLWYVWNMNFENTYVTLVRKHNWFISHKYTQYAYTRAHLDQQAHHNRRLFRLYHSQFNNHCHGMVQVEQIHEPGRCTFIIIFSRLVFFICIYFLNVSKNAQQERMKKDILAQQRRMFIIVVFCILGHLVKALHQAIFEKKKDSDKIK